MSHYVALLRKDPDSDYGVDFPDFPGCVTAGKTLDEARRMAEDALRFHVAGVLEDGDVIPDPQSLEAVMEDPDNREAVAFLVDVPQTPSKKVRVNVTVPEAALKRIDDYARTHGMNRSSFLTTAALDVIARRAT